MAGLERIELPPSVSKTEMISISPKPELLGPAYRNRTHIRGVEDLCIIHYTNTGKINCTTLFTVCHLYWCSSQESNLNFYFTKVVFSHLTTRALVPLPRFERGEFLLLRETTLPICPQGHYLGCLTGIDPVLPLSQSRVQATTLKTP